MSTQEKRPFDAIVFDLGGVLIELAGVSRMLELLGHRLTPDELWVKWLTSPSVQQFESGHISAEQFAMDLLTELELSISATQFIDEFTAWPQGLYPGTVELLQTLAPQYTVACLTNTNSLHWPRFCNEMGLLDHFAIQFASHEIGLVKPDPAIFQHVVERLACDPARILFLDDNTLNVDAARAAGISAYRVVGFAATVEHLTALDILPRP